jgi:hypothetical protein
MYGQYKSGWRQWRDQRDKLLGSEPLPVSAAAKAGDDHGVTEITEELNEDGNAVSSSMSTPGVQVSGLTEILEKLKKAGVKNLPQLTAKKETPAWIDAVDGDEAELKPELPSEVKQSNYPAKSVSGFQRNASPKSPACRVHCLDYWRWTVSRGSRHPIPSQLLPTLVDALLRPLDIFLYNCGTNHIDQ